MLHKKTNILALTALAAGTLALPQAPAQAQLFGISEQQEIQYGQQVGAQAEKEYGGALPANHPYSVKVRAMGNRFAQLSERKNIPYTFKVLNNDKVLNAFAAPGGPIYVTKKLVDTAANDAELAYVLGHETAHIDRKHIVKSVEKQQKVGLGVGILGAILGRGSSGNVLGTIANVSFTLWERGYSRDHERESDVVGTRWMSQLGYDPRAAVSMLGRLGGGSGGGVGKYLATHPDPKSRQQMVTNLIQQENLLDVARRSGGPRLADNNSYSNTGNYASTTPDSYNQPTYTSSPNSGTVYPGSTAGNQYPTTTYPTTTTGGSNTVSVRLVNRGEYNVVLASVADMASFAGASAQANGNTVTMTRGGRSIEFRRNSTVAFVDGRGVTMTAPPEVYDGRFYAPLGTIAQALGGSATYESQTRTVRVDLDGRTIRAQLPA